MQIEGIGIIELAHEAVYKVLKEGNRIIVNATERVALQVQKLSKNGAEENVQQDIVIFDDLFPHPVSAFRFQEYNAYLEHFKKIKIYSTGSSLKQVKAGKTIETAIKGYEKEFPQFKGKVEKYSPKTILHPKTLLHSERIPQSMVIYTIFLNNIYFYLDTIERYKTPFVFTLYPGGGFYLNDKISDEKLKKSFLHLTSGRSL